VFAHESVSAALNERQLRGMTVPDILSIGELAGRAGCQVETVRYYERVGIMPSPPRSAGGHRQYSFEHFKRLSFVRRCRDLGINLKRTRGLLELIDEGGDTCGQVKEIASGHLAEIRRKLSDLRKMEGVMKEMVAACDDGEIPDCPIIEALFDARR